MLKLYKKNDIDTSYAECWVHDNVACIHTGTVGDVGQNEKVLCSNEDILIANFQQKYTLLGYTPWPEERLNWVVLQWPMKTLQGDASNRDMRDSAMMILDELLGWAGLGHVDGYDMGKTANPKEEFALNVYCLVVDSYIAIECILKSLPKQLDCSRLKIASRQYDEDEYIFEYHAKKRENWFFI